jgi:membrane fusion protein (multidrug efflux system)
MNYKPEDKIVVDAAAQDIEARKNRRQRFGRVLMVGGVAAVLAAGAFYYLHSGRYISTDNAYIKAAKILVTPEVNGPVLTVLVKDNQSVKKGDKLLTVDTQPYEIAAAKAEADLNSALVQVAALKSRYLQKQADIEKAKVQVAFTANELERQKNLFKTHATSQSVVDDATRAHDDAEKEVAVLQEESNEIVSELSGNPEIDPAGHPLVQTAQATLDKAKLDLSHTTLLAPADGIVGAVPHPGDYAHAGVPMLDLVGTNEVWIDANFKETELTHVKPGQKVKIDVDTYPGHEWAGEVESISPATGSEFSVLPAQNATGNWVKVVQRLAVRIGIDPQKDAPALRAGMSTDVSIDTGSYPHLKLIGK